MIYWDTSVVLTLYADESDSEIWQARAISEAGPLMSSQLMRAEFAMAMRAKEQRKELRRGAASRLINTLNRDIDDGLVQVHPVSAEVITAAVGLAGKLTGALSLRTLDGLHLATALLLDCRSLATTDHRLAKAAKAANLDVIS